MPSYYGGGGSSSSGSSGGGGSFSPGPTFTVSGSPTMSENDNIEGLGKTNIDLSDLPGSVGDALGSLAGFAGSLGGGALGLAGQIGIPGGPNLGDIPEAAGDALGAVGSVKLPYLGNDPTRTNATLGNVPGKIGDIISLPGRAFERTVAGRKAEGAAEFLRQRDNLTPEQRKDFLRLSGLPTDLMLALDQGEITVDQFADQLVARNAGFSPNPIENTAGQIVLDPLNLIAPGVSKAARAAAATDAGIAVARGLSKAGAATMERVLGPATSGVFHSLGTKPFFSIRNGLGRVSQAYVQPFEDALRRGASQFAPAVVARHMADEVELAFKVGGDDALERFPRGENLDRVISERVSAKQAIDPAHLERRVEEMADKVVPSFRGVDPATMTDETARKLATIVGASPEDALRSLGGKVSREQARMVHLAFYGKAGHDLSLAKAASVGAKNIDAERVTILAPDTLTNVRADELLDAIKAGDGAAVEDAVARYDILSRKFGRRQIDNAKVAEYVKNLKTKDALPAQVIPPTTGKNALPAALSEWRARYGEFGYELGFAPEDGWKAIVDDAGETIITDPFVHFQDEALPLTYRNPLGRFTDSLFRGVTQTKIVQGARSRFLDQTAKAGVPDADADRLFGAILETARERRTTPRGLSILGGHEYDNIFRDVLGDEAFTALRQKTSPTYMVMSAFEGRLRDVGLTQKITGRVKTALAEVGNIPAGIAEGIYPLMRFKYRPIFQSQELIESPFWNTLRGAHPQNVSEQAARIYNELTEIGPEFRYLTEAGYFTHLIGTDATGKIVGYGSRIGKAMETVLPKGGVAGFKEKNRIIQVFAEHGEYFENAVKRLNPDLWKHMAEAYGTRDARQIAEKFVAERFALATDQNAIRAFADPVLAGARSIDEETVYQGFLEAWRQSSKQAFKTHYFSPERGWLERTINHPYLGLYPASYMWGKVLPEFARFLIARPFGLRAPMVGLAAYERVQQALIEEVATNPDFAGWMKDNKDAIYLTNIMLPGEPGSIPVNVPAYARHVAEDLAFGKKVDPEAALKKESADMVRYASIAGDVGTLASASGDIFDTLAKAAAEFDGMFGGKKPSAPPPPAPTQPRLPALAP